MLKRVLVPLDPSPNTEAVLEWVCPVAKRHGAELTGMVVLDIQGILDSIGPVPLGGFHYAKKLEKAREREARKHIDVLLARFEEKCRSSGVAYRIAKHQGAPSKQIIYKSIYFDAVVIGLRTCFRFGEAHGECDSLEDLLNESITPVYGIPASANLPDFSREKMQIVIAFDGSPASARALHRFAQLAAPDVMEVTLLKSDQDIETARRQLDQAEAFLKAHSLTHITKEVTSQHIIEALDERFMKRAHLIVVGAQSKHGLFDFMLGSLSKHLIKEAKRPLLIAP